MPRSLSSIVQRSPHQNSHQIPPACVRRTVQTVRHEPRAPIQPERLRIRVVADEPEFAQLVFPPGDGEHRLDQKPAGTLPPVIGMDDDVAQPAVRTGFDLVQVAVPDDGFTAQNDRQADPPFGLARKLSGIDKWPAKVRITSVHGRPDIPASPHWTARRLLPDSTRAPQSSVRHRHPNVPGLLHVQSTQWRSC